MEDIGLRCNTVNILDVLGVDLCARAILDYVPVRELVRSERVCKRWQEIVLNYLQRCPTLKFEGFLYFYNYIYYPVFIKNHRTIVIIPNNDHLLPLVCKTLDKWGPYVMKVITDIGENGYLDIIVSRCPNVQEFEIVLSEDDDPRPISGIKTLKYLKHIKLQNFICFSDNNNSDQVLGEVLQEMNCKKIVIDNNKDLTGSFLKYLNSNSLETLTLMQCQALRVSDLMSAAQNLQNVTRLELDDNNIAVFDNVHLLLKEMPQLEELALRNYRYTTPLSGESITSFSRLASLKRLDLSGNDCVVSDTLLEALALTCKKLEYLDIRGSASTISARGLAALCHREPAALTTLHFGYDPDYATSIISQFSLEKDFMRLKHIPVYQELERLGCVELTWQWFYAAICDPRGRKLPFQVEQGTARSGTPLPELKLIMNS